MKRMNKIIGTVLCAAMLAASLTACGDGKTSGNEASQAGSSTVQSTESSTPAATGEVSKPDSILWWVHSGMNEENGTAQWVEEFEKMTGIDMNLQIVSNNEYTQMLELSFASGEVPEVFDLSGDNLAVYAKQNAIADLTDYIKNSDFYDKVDQDTWDAISLNGKIYGVPMEIPSGAVTYVRKDWLDRLGMSVPATYDEYITMLKRFKEEIPECTVPVTAPAIKTAMNLPEMFQGATPEFIKKDGKWIDGMGEDNMLTALTNLQNAYADGLLDSEVITNTTSNCRDQWYGGSVGVFNYWGGLWGKTLTERIKMNVPEAEVIAIPPIEGVQYEFAIPTLLCISSRVSEEKIASIFEHFFAYMHDGKEGQVLFQSGVENIHWKQEGDNIVALPTLSNQEEIFSKAWITPWMSISEVELTDKKVELDQMVVDSLAIINEYGVEKNVYPVSATLTKIKADLELVKQEVIAKVIMGDLTPEDGLNKYREEAKRLNVAQVLTEMNE